MIRYLYISIDIPIPKTEHIINGVIPLSNGIFTCDRTMRTTEMIYPWNKKIGNDRMPISIKSLLLLKCSDNTKIIMAPNSEKTILIITPNK